MLLLIVLANTPIYLYGEPHSGAGFHPIGGSPVDQAVQALLIITVNLRVYPMFAFLFGYGLWMIHRRQLINGSTPRQAAGILHRRNAWLIVFGFLHALLLWSGDILGAYGLCGLLLVRLLMRRADRTLLMWAGIGTGVAALFVALTVLGAASVLVGGQPAPAAATAATGAFATVAEDNPLTAAVGRIMAWLMQVVVSQGPLGMITPVSILLGIWAARHRVLEQPDLHRSLLWAVAVCGVLVGWFGALPTHWPTSGSSGAWRR